MRSSSLLLPILLTAALALLGVLWRVHHVNGSEAGLVWEGFLPRLRLSRSSPCQGSCLEGTCVQGECTFVVGRAGPHNDFGIRSLHPYVNPYDDMGPRMRPLHLQGWVNAEPSFWTQRVNETRPKIAVEVGVWLGATTQIMAREMKQQWKGGVVVAVDTWLGALEFFPAQYSLSQRTPPVDMERDLRLDHGYPTIYYSFLSNMIHMGVSDMVIPFAAQSTLAAAWFAKQGLRINLLHVDGSHEYEEVVADIRAWWPLLSEDGIMVGDDFSMQYWPGVVRAVREFALLVRDTHDLCLVPPKWFFRPRRTHAGAHCLD